MEKREEGSEGKEGKENTHWDCPNLWTHPHLLPLAALRHEIQEMSFKFEITSEFFRTKSVENTTHWVRYAQWLSKHTEEAQKDTICPALEF